MKTAGSQRVFLVPAVDALLSVVNFVVPFHFRWRVAASRETRGREDNLVVPQSTRPFRTSS
jgi:hypothetical protein